MSIKRFGLLCLSPLLLIATTAVRLPRHALTPRFRKSDAPIRTSYGNLALSFEPNQGQTDGRVDFMARGKGFTLFLTPDEAVLSVSSRTPTPARDLGLRSATQRLQRKSISNRKQTTRPEVVRFRVVGAAARPKVTASDQLPGKVNYLKGNDPKKWRTGVSTYGRVKYSGVYPGIDLEYYGRQGYLEHDFIVAPHADPQSICLEFEGAKKLEIDRKGDLILHTNTGAVVSRKPVVYQQIDGKRREVDGHYVRRPDKNRVGFEVASYDRDAPLVIDPIIIYASAVSIGSSGGGGAGIIGGVGQAGVFGGIGPSAIAAGSDGNAYMTGSTTSIVFPTKNPFQANPGNPLGGLDAFVLKLDTSGNLEYSTYLGGSGSDSGNGIGVDSDGAAYITGSTTSVDFPVANSIQATHHGGSDVFATKLSPDGSSLVYSTFLGGSGNDSGNGIAVDTAGGAYITGYTDSSDFPTVNALQPTIDAASHSFVAKILPDGSGFAYSTYLARAGTAIAVDTSGQACVVNVVTGIAKLTADGSTLIISMSIPGTSITAVALDVSGNAYVTGSATKDLKLKQPFNSSGGSSGNATFVAALKADGTDFLYSSYLPTGSGVIWSSPSIAIDAQGYTYVAGTSDESGFLELNPLPPHSNNGIIGSPIVDAFITKILPQEQVVNWHGPGLPFAYSTLFGGCASDLGTSIATDGHGNAYLAGISDSPDLPVHFGFHFGDNPPFTFIGAYVVKVADIGVPGGRVVASPQKLEFGPVPQGSAIVLPISITNSGSDPLTVNVLPNLRIYEQQPCPFTVLSGGGSYTLSPSETRIIIIEFRPINLGLALTFSDLLWTIPITTSDPVHPRLSITLSGKGI